jgi:hypothetical protein
MEFERSLSIEIGFHSSTSAHNAADFACSPGIECAKDRCDCRIIQVMQPSPTDRLGGNRGVIFWRGFRPISKRDVLGIRGRLHMIAVRWISRILGLLLVVLCLVLMIGQQFNPLGLKGHEIAQAASLLVALVGMILLWRRQLLGGALVVAGMGLFYAINFAASGRLPTGYVFPLCFLPGILALVEGWSAAHSRLSP